MGLGILCVFARFSYFTPVSLFVQLSELFAWKDSFPKWSVIYRAGRDRFRRRVYIFRMASDSSYALCCSAL